MITMRCATLILTLANFLAMTPALAEEPPRRLVEGSDLVSTALPTIRVHVAPPFRYVGTFHFTIRDVAEGDRYVFVDAADKRVQRMFIAQFEGYRPGKPNTYNYSFKIALMLGGHRFKHNTFAFSVRADEKENPQNEGVLTAKFLKQKGLSVEDELMSSRFVTVPDKERRHELILFYIENVKAHGHTLSELYERDEPTTLWKNLGKGLTERSLKAFKIVN